MKIISRNLKLLSLGALTLGCLAGLSGQSLADEARAVGSVVDIDGPVLMTNRLKESKWYQAYPSMNTYFRERMKADEKTTATIEFAVGGRAVISPGTEVEIVDQEAKVLKVKNGALWAKFDKQDTEFQIQTAGGVMGIEGTEFLVETDPKTGDTKLVVIEGAVSVDNQTGDSLVEPGKEAKFGEQALDVAEYAAYNTPESAMRDAAFSRVDPDTAAVLRPVVNRILWRVGSRGLLGRYFYSTELWYARRAIAFFRDPKRAFRNEASREISRRTGGIGGGMFRAGFDAATKDPEPVREIETRTAKSGSAGEGGRPEFKWKGSKGAHQYAVVVARDSDAQDVVWYGTTKDTEMKYPSYGPELNAGTTYYALIMPLNKEGKPHTHDDQTLGGSTTFTSSGHKPVYGKVDKLTALGATGTPTVKWRSVRDSNLYRVQIKNAAGETVWVDESRDDEYNYPDTARSLPAGEYAVAVEAYDSSGVLMAESEADATFITSSWVAGGIDGEPREEEDIIEEPTPEETSQTDEVSADCSTILETLRAQRS